MQSTFGAKQAPEHRTRRPAACSMHGKHSKPSTNQRRRNGKMQTGTQSKKHQRDSRFSATSFVSGKKIASRKLCSTNLTQYNKNLGHRKVQELHDSLTSHRYKRSLVSVYVVNPAVGGEDGDKPTIAKMAVQMSCASELCRTEWTKFRLGKLGNIAPMRAHARYCSVLLVLDVGRGRWRGRWWH